MNKMHIFDLALRKKKWNMKYSVNFFVCLFLTQLNSDVCERISRTVVFCGLVLNIKVIYHRLFFDRLGPGASSSDPAGKNQVDIVKI